MVQLYIKHTDNNFYLLDLDLNENVNLKVSAKDLNDISKVLSPYTQTIKFKATEKNKILFGFFGNEKTLKANNTDLFDIKMYVGGFVFQTGVFDLKTTDYKSLEQDGFSGVFASNLTGTVDKLGELTIQDVFAPYKSELPTIAWNGDLLRGFGVLKWKTLSNGIDINYTFPFLSNKRVWKYDKNNLGTFDNIAYSPFYKNENALVLNELRPSVNFLAVLRMIIEKIGVPVICPLFDEIGGLQIWGNTETLQPLNEQFRPLTGYGVPLFEKKDIDTGEDSNVISPYRIEYANDVFSVIKNPIVGVDKVDKGVIVQVKLIGASAEAKWRVRLVNAVSGAEIKTATITGSEVVFDFTPSFEFSFKIEILPLDFIIWQKIEYIVKHSYIHSFFTRGAISLSGTINTSSTDYGADSISVIHTLPAVKCIDFLRSFFKTFNIIVVSTGLEDGSMYWLTQDDVKKKNEPYSKRTVDYTNYATPKALSKKKANDFNMFSFSHAKSKYYEAEYGNGTAFGSLTHPEIIPKKPTKFEVKTDFSILKTSDRMVHPKLTTCLGFSKDIAEILPNGYKRYKPVFDELTIFFLDLVQVDNYTQEIAVNTGKGNNLSVDRAYIPTYKNPLNGKTLAFGGENQDTNSLFKNYYSDFINMILNKNAYLSTFEIDLPPNEIFLNFANQTQGESNIPTGFRAQNEIIISEQRYYMADISIGLTNGKTKLNVINI